MKNQYFVLRHGQNIYQTKKKGFLYPWPDSPPVKLTEKGRRQARKTAGQLKSKKIDLLYSSDIYRARETAEIVAKELGIDKIHFDKRLRDINHGVFHGKTKKEFYKRFPDAVERFSRKAERGENWSEVRKRMLDFFREIERKHKNKNILIVSHGDPLWLLEGAVKKWSKKKLLDQIFKKKYIQVGEWRKLKT